MALLISTGTLVIAAMISIVINRQWLPRVSINYVSMLVGAVIAIVPLFNGLVEQFDSEIFIGLIVAPLLYFEGQGTRMNLVGRHVKAIISLTVGMVVLCAVVAELAGRGRITTGVYFGRHQHADRRDRDRVGDDGAGTPWTRGGRFKAGITL